MLGRLLTAPDRLAAALAPHRAVVRGVFGAVLALLFVATVGLYLRKVGKPSDAGTYTRSAFLRWKPQIEALDRGEDIYANYEYPNPPVMALILRPFTKLSSPTDAVVWLVVKALLAAVSFVWVFRLTADAEHPWSPFARMLAVLLALHPILSDLSHGNVNIFVAFLLFACLELFRRRLDLTAGVVLALAIACKVTPALFVPYFGWKAVYSGWTTRTWGGVWRGGGAVLTGCGIGLVAWLVVVPGFALGFERNTTLLQSWYNQMARPFVADGLVRAEYSNQSLPGVVYGFFTTVPLAGEADDDGKQPKRRETLIDLGPAWAKRIVFGGQVAFVLAVFALCRAPVTDRRQGLWLAAECAFVALGMLLFSERTWKHHATTLMLPVAVLVAAWVTRTPGIARRALLAGILLACVLLDMIPSLLGGSLQDDGLEYGSHTAVFLLLAIGVAAVMWWERRG